MNPSPGSDRLRGTANPGGTGFRSVAHSRQKGRKPAVLSVPGVTLDATPRIGIWRAEDERSTDTTSSNSRAEGLQLRGRRQVRPLRGGGRGPDAGPGTIPAPAAALRAGPGPEVGRTRPFGAAPIPLGGDQSGRWLLRPGIKGTRERSLVTFWLRKYRGGDRRLSTFFLYSSLPAH
jgi:hypothetical protein